MPTHLFRTLFALLSLIASLAILPAEYGCRIVFGLARMGGDRKGDRKNE